MSSFKIAAAQIASVRGNVSANILAHSRALVAAAAQEVTVLVFPELSLTGYEPDLAADLAMTPCDARLAPLRALASEHGVEVLLGAPLQSGTPKPYLGAIHLRADGGTRAYYKMHLGSSERTYFLAGAEPMTLTARGQKIGVAICADSSQRSHPQTYAAAGSTIYAAGVFLNTEWYATDAPRLADYAARYRMLTVMANHADSIGTYPSVGKSAVWAPDDGLLAEAAGVERCLVIAACREVGWRAEVVRI